MNMYKKTIKNSFEKNGYEVLLPDINYKNVSFCFVNVKSNRETYCRIKNSPIYYYVIDGDGKFFIDDIVDINKGDLIEIPQNIKYTYSGNLNMLEIIPNSFDDLEVEETTVD